MEQTLFPLSLRGFASRRSAVKAKENKSFGRFDEKRFFRPGQLTVRFWVSGRVLFVEIKTQGEVDSEQSTANSNQ
jgi:hypothetical protein